MLSIKLNDSIYAQAFPELPPNSWSSQRIRIGTIPIDILHTNQDNSLKVITVVDVGEIPSGTIFNVFSQDIVPLI